MHACTPTQIRVYNRSYMQCIHPSEASEGNEGCMGKKELNGARENPPLK